MPADAVRPVVSKMRARISDAVADAVGMPAKIFRHVEIGFVERERFDLRRIVSEDRVNFTRHGAIDVESRRYDHEVWAFARRRARRHCRVDAEFARLVAGGGNDTALRGIADSDRATTQRGVVALLDRRVESVHVDVDDLAHGSTKWSAPNLSV
jgi:hypothetical protein